MKATFRNLLFVLSEMALAGAVLYMILLLFGFRPFILTSPSMEPLYKTGSLILVNTRARPEDVRIGDVLVYRSKSGVLVMHRLVDQNTFKGDRNESTEHIPLDSTTLVGSVRLSLYIPGFSELLKDLQAQPWILWILLASLLIMSCIPWRTEMKTRPENHISSQKLQKRPGMSSPLKSGTRVKLVRMEDPYPLPPGSAGTILRQDSNGDYEVHWDNGSALKLIPGADEWEIISNE